MDLVTHQRAFMSSLEFAIKMSCIVKKLFREQSKQLLQLYNTADSNPKQTIYGLCSIVPESYTCYSRKIPSLLHINMGIVTKLLDIPKYQQRTKLKKKNKAQKQ